MYENLGFYRLKPINTYSQLILFLPYFLSSSQENSRKMLKFFTSGNRGNRLRISIDRAFWQLHGGIKPLEIGDFSSITGIFI